jgi:hypothetical protein
METVMKEVILAASILAGVSSGAVAETALASDARYFAGVTESFVHAGLMAEPAETVADPYGEAILTSFERAGLIEARRVDSSHIVVSAVCK